MQGSPRGDAITKMFGGPIPAHAGQPQIRPARRSGRRAYPRACGAAQVVKFVGDWGKGRSPRMRGSPMCAKGHGKIGRAYPRACGAAYGGQLGADPDGGLSPRMRGSLEACHDRVSVGGPIPAHAGQPRGTGVWVSRPWAYPRACGAAGLDTAYLVPFSGLSPRMRGSRGRWAAYGAPMRPIPAHAGQPGPAQRPSPSYWAYPRACGAARIAAAR